MHQLLKLVKAPGREIAELKKLYDAQRQSGAAASPAAAQPAPAPKLDLAIGEALVKPLKPWIEVALPHPDVLANRFKEAELRPICSRSMPRIMAQKTASAEFGEVTIR
jgi:hypothetical protein